MALASTSFILAVSTPSTITNGALLLLKDPKPLILICPASAPGCPEPCLTVTPGAMPCKPMLTLAKGRLINWSPFMVAIAPVILPFFCVP